MNIADSLLNLELYSDCTIASSRWRGVDMINIKAKVILFLVAYTVSGVTYAARDAALDKAFRFDVAVETASTSF